MKKEERVFEDVPFRGEPRAMYVLSDEDVHLRWHNSGKETEQRLAVNSEGGVWFSGYELLPYYEESKMLRSRYFCIAKEEANRLLRMVARYFGTDTYNTNIHECDCGGWRLKLINTEGEEYCYWGCWGDSGGISMLSVRTREILGFHELYVFDRNDRLRVLRKITVERYRPEVVGLESGMYRETLILDLDQKSIEVSRESQLMGNFHKTYDFKKRDKYFAKDFRDRFDTPDLFLHTGDEDLHDGTYVARPQRETNYRITLDYRKSLSRVIEGYFDRKGLPTDFGKFADFMRKKLGGFHDSWETLNPDFYNRPRGVEEE